MVSSVVITYEVRILFLITFLLPKMSPSKPLPPEVSHFVHLPLQSGIYLKGSLIELISTIFVSLAMASRRFPEPCGALFRVAGSSSHGNYLISFYSRRSSVVSFSTSCEVLTLSGLPMMKAEHPYYVATNRREFSLESPEPSDSYVSFAPRSWPHR